MNYGQIGPSGQDKCTGPGVCYGHTMPCDIAAICAAAGADTTNKKTSAERGASPRSRDKEDRGTCPGGTLCPGPDVCPHCNDAHHLQTIKSTKKPAAREDKDDDEMAEDSDGRTTKSPRRATTDLLTKEMKSMILLPSNLEDLRLELKAGGKMVQPFDENDILEKMTTLWEAVTALNHNDEALAVRLIKHDAVIKKIPQGALDKLQAGDLDRMVTSSDASLAKQVKPIFVAPLTRPSDRTIGGEGLSKEEVQLIFTNLNNLLVDSAAGKLKLDTLTESVRQMENQIVTKQMMVDALTDKADKGQMNTKVSYDEFGNSMDELMTRMQNLLVEVFQNNETWKRVTDQLANELADKLNKTELAPVRSYFKSHLKALEERVRYLTQQLEEPDPAGTRRKLLKDMNCLSCNRHASISGVTNAPILPLIGPILAGHQTGSRRAFDLHNMRVKARFDPDACNLNILEAKLRAVDKQQGGRPVNEPEIQQLVSRYVGGSHTAVSNAERMASFHRSRLSNLGGETGGLPPIDQEGDEEAEEQIPVFYEDVVNEQHFPFLDTMEE